MNRNPRARAQPGRQNRPVGSTPTAKPVQAPVAELMQRATQDLSLLSADQFMQLQTALGNRSVQRLVRPSPMGAVQKKSNRPQPSRAAKGDHADIQRAPETAAEIEPDFSGNSAYDLMNELMLLDKKNRQLLHAENSDIPLSGPSGYMVVSPNWIYITGPDGIFDLYENGVENKNIQEGVFFTRELGNPWGTAYHYNPNVTVRGAGSKEVIGVPLSIMGVSLDLYDEKTFRKFRPYLRGSQFLYVVSMNEIAQDAEVGEDGNETEAAEEFKPDKPGWAKAQTKLIRSRLKTDKGKNREAIQADEAVTYYSKRTRRWHANIWVNLDSQGKERVARSIPLKPHESVEELMARVDQAARDAYTKHQVQLRREATGKAPAYARRLLKDLQTKLARIGRRDKQATDLPDELSLEFIAAATEAPSAMRVGSPKPDGEASRTYLHVYVDNKENNGGKKRIGGAMPWPLTREMTSADLIGPVREVAGRLRQQTQEIREEGFVKSPTMGQPTLPGQQAANQPQLPARLEPKDLRGDRITVTGAQNEFNMRLNYGSTYFNHQVSMVVANMNTVNFWWEIHDVSDMGLSEGGEAPSWPAKARWLQNRFPNDKPTDLTADRRTYAEGKRFESTKRVKFPEKPGDYLVTAIGTPEADNERDLIYPSSFAYFPVRVKHAKEVGRAAVTSTARRARAIKKALADDSQLPKGEKESLARELASLEAGEAKSLRQLTREQEQDTNRMLRKIERLEKFLAQNKAIEGNRIHDPIMLKLTDADLRQIYMMTVGTGVSLKKLKAQYKKRQSQLKDVKKRIKKFSGEFDGGSTYQYRPEAVVVSKITGQTYPLLLQVGEADHKPPWAKAAYTLIDVTSSGTQGAYTGFSATTGPVGHREAIDNAFEKFGEKAKYGEGTISVRFPAGAVGHDDPHHPTAGPGDVKHYKSEPGPVEVAMDWLGKIAMAAGAIALIASGVGAVGVAGIAGALAAAGGAVTAGYNIQQRAQSKTLSLDIELALDIISIAAVIPIVGSVAQIGKGARATRIAGASARIAGVSRYDDFLVIFNAVQTGGDYVLTPIKMVQDIYRIQNDPNLTDEQKDAMVNQILLEGLQNGIMNAGGGMASHLSGSREARAHFDEVMQGRGDNYISLADRGWIDPDTNTWTDKAPPSIREAAAANGNMPPPHELPANENRLPTAGAEAAATRAGPDGEIRPGNDADPVRDQPDIRDHDRSRARPEMEEVRAGHSEVTPSHRRDTQTPIADGATERDGDSTGGPTYPRADTVVDNRNPAFDDPNFDAKAVVSGEADMNKLREDVRKGIYGDSEGIKNKAGEVFDRARMEILEDYEGTVKRDIEQQYEGMSVTFNAPGTPGFKSDVDVTVMTSSRNRVELERLVRASEGDVAEFREMAARVQWVDPAPNIDQLAAALEQGRVMPRDVGRFLHLDDLRREVRSSMEATRLLYERLGDPDRRYDANFYTSLRLHDMMHALEPDPATMRQLQIEQGNIVSMAEMIRNMSTEEWKAYKQKQFEEFRDTHGSNQNKLASIQEWEAQYKAAEALAASVNETTLAEAKQQLDAELAAGELTPERVYDLMSRIMLLEPDAYGSVAAFYDVVLHQQTGARRQELVANLEEHLTMNNGQLYKGDTNDILTRIYYESGVDVNRINDTEYREKNKNKFDLAESRIVEEISRIREDVESFQLPPGVERGSQEYIAHLGQSASANMAKLFHAENVPSIAKYLRRILVAGNESGATLTNDIISERMLLVLIRSKKLPTENQQNGSRKVALSHWATEAGLFDPKGMTLAQLEAKFTELAREVAQDHVTEMRVAEYMGRR